MHELLPIVTQIEPVAPSDVESGSTCMLLSEEPTTPCTKYNRRAIRLELIATFITVIITIIATCISTMAQEITTRRAISMAEKTAAEGYLTSLPDLLHQLFPSTMKHGLADIALDLPIALALVLLAIQSPLIATSYLRRTFIGWDQLLMIRCISILGTQFPDPDMACIRRLTPGTRGLLEQLIGHLLGHPMQCGDLLFSGHTTLGVTHLIFASCALSAITGDARAARHAIERAVKMGGQRPSKLPLWVRVPTWYSTITIPVLIVLCILLVISLMATRFHYTVDVLLAALLTGLSVPLKSAFVSSWVRSHPVIPWSHGGGKPKNVGEALSQLILLLTFGGAPVPSALLNGKRMDMAPRWASREGDTRLLIRRLFE